MIASPSKRRPLDRGARYRHHATPSLCTLLLLLHGAAHAQDSSDGVEAYEEGSPPEVEFYEPEVVTDAARDVLSRPEFRNVPRLDLGPGGTESEPLKSKEELRKEQEVEVRRPSAGSNLLSGLFGGAVSMAVVLVLVVVLGAIVALIALGLRAWERTEKAAAKGDGDAGADDDPDPLLTPGEKPADAWLAAARAAAAAGRFDEALSLLLLGAMGHAERAGLIRPRRGLTYRDYLRAVPDTSAWHGTLDGLIRIYAPVGFGRRHATSAVFESALGPYERALMLEPPTPVAEGSSIMPRPT